MTIIFLYKDTGKIYYIAFQIIMNNDMRNILKNLYIILSNSNIKIITLCGSTKFKNTFLTVNQYLTFQNKIVLMPGVYGHSDNIEISEDEKENLDKLHKEKILMSNAILVINNNNYIGESTKSEIEFAKNHGKIIIYLE